MPSRRPVPVKRVSPTTPARGTSRPRPAAAKTRPTGRQRESAAEGLPRAQVQVPRLFTVRVLLLGGVLVLSSFLVFPTLNEYLAQRAELNATQRDLALAEQQKANLENELHRWEDPAYVTSQARTRLSFVTPGEQPFRVVDPESAVTSPDVADGPTGSLAGHSGETWFDDVWTSVRIAGEAEVG